MKIYVVMYENSYGREGIECAFMSEEEALEYVKKHERCGFWCEEVELIQSKEKEC